ncbi:hypothetical protein LT85_1502 [Collimonas arenae]|uniref:Uncharacterized protein n=1 Tax=Collimonas arenae TaxID=279058 RepID=A0A0A1FA59_9BURK|nr:hypothetical protein LT85_1502 [Collimonas arenae]
MLTILECLRNFIKHNISFHFADRFSGAVVHLTTDDSSLAVANELPSPCLEPIRNLTARPSA